MFGTVGIAVGWAAVIGGWLLDGAGERLDAVGEHGDLCAQAVDLVQQQPGQLGVVGIEAAVERRDQCRVLGLKPTSGQIGQPAWVAFAGEHVPHRQTIQPRGHRGHLDQRVLK